MGLKIPREKCSTPQTIKQKQIMHIWNASYWLAKVNFSGVKHTSGNLIYIISLDLKGGIFHINAWKYDAILNIRISTNAMLNIKIFY